MSDKFSIDDILAEFSDDKNEKNTQKPQVRSSNTQPSKQTPGATMILRSIDEKKNSQSSKSDTKEILPKSSAMTKADTVQNNPAKSVGTEKKTVSDKPAAHKPVSYKGLDEFEEKKATAKKRESNFHNSAAASVGNNTKKHTDAQHSATAVRKKAANSGTRPAVKSTHKSEKVKVSINTSANMSFMDKINQYKFLFAELTKRDFKKKYKRTILGVLWSVISPFMTFLVQYFVFGFIFRRHDTQFVIYLLSGTLMYNFFTNATTAGMFSMYSNGGILSKVNVPKSLFVLSSNSAAIFNFLLTLIIYFAFMIFCHVSFGIHLLMMIYPIICLTIFNIGMSYILSSLFVFFRDMQYLYQIFTMLLMYMSAIFYETTRFPENLRFVFDINPIYRYISYMRSLVISATVPDLASHVICLAFSLGMLAIGYCVHKKTEQKFVYYY